MSDDDRNPARDAFILGWALMTGAVTTPDDAFEAARGAFISAMEANDPEWSPRASSALGEMMFWRGDADSAERYLDVALNSAHPDSKPAADVLQGLICASRGDAAGAAGAFGRAIASRHPAHCPNAWFNLGALHQQRGDAEEAVEAFRHAMAGDHRESKAKAAVNLGFVLFNQVGDIEGARDAFQQAIAAGVPEQSALAERNLAAMEAVSKNPGTWTAADDGTDLSRPPKGQRGAFMRRFFFSKDDKSR